MIKITDLLNKFKKTEPNTATVSTNGEAVPAWKPFPRKVQSAGKHSYRKH